MAIEFDREDALEFARNQLAHEWNSKEHWDIIEAVWRLNKSLKPDQEKMRFVGLDKDWDAPRVQIVLKTKPQDSHEFQPDGDDHRARWIAQVLLGASTRGNITVTGLKDTVHALKEGRVHTLVLVDNHKIEGCLCGDCGNADIPVWH